ncbi:MAG TPA: ABC transporter permease [Vicinamibacterales bacterium]
MRRFLGWCRRMGGVFAAGDAEIADELACHLQLAIDDNVRSGMTPGEARRRALLQLGGLEQSMEGCREQRTAPFVESVVRDLAHGLRLLAKHRGFAAAAIVVLALGIGANTAIFSVVDAVLLRPLPFPDAGRLVAVWHVPPPHLFSGRPTFPVSPANFLDWRAQTDAFDALAIYRNRHMTVTGRGEATSLVATLVSADFFPILQTSPRLGRAIGDSDEQPGREQVVVLKETIWQSRFGADPHVVGQSLLLDGRPFEVVGVMPQRTAFPEDADLWVPLAWTPAERAVRGNHTYSVIGRLKRGVDLEHAQSELTTVADRLAAQYPADNKGWGAVAVPLHDDLVGDVRPALLVLVGAVALVALIACANVANLLLARTLARAREIAVRTALGAARRRVIRQLLTENLLLGIGGAIVGAAIGQLGLAAIVATVGQQLPRVHEIGLDHTVLAFTAALGLLTSVVSGAIPAWRLTHQQNADSLKQREGTSAGQRRLRNVLVVSEVALAMMLLISAGLLLRTLWNLQAVDPGFDSQGVLTMSVSLPAAKYPEPGQRVQFYRAALERLRTLPGVEAAAGTDSLPLEDGSIQPVAIAGQPPAALSDQPEVQVRYVTPDYGRTLRMRVVAGHDFSDADSWDAPAVVLISEAMARRFWPGVDPIGRSLTLGLISDRPRRVVGVVNDVKYLGLDVSDPIAAVYVPMAQTAPPGISFVIRTASRPDALGAAATRAIHEIDPEEAVVNVLPLDAVVGASVQSQRFNMLLLSTFAALALVLAAAGIHSVLSYSVTQRVPEIGIEMALGAPIGSVIRKVVVEGLKPALIGLALGVAGALTVAGALNRLLFGVSVRDASTIGAVALLVIVVTLFATLLPAWRATLVDPMVALRAE